MGKHLKIISMLRRNVSHIVAGMIVEWLKKKTDSKNKYKESSEMFTEILG